MKKIIILFCLFTIKSFGQNTKIIDSPSGTVISNSSGTDIPYSASILDIRSSNKGVLFPRMITSNRDAITLPVAGLMIYNTTSNQFNYHNGTSWQELASGNQWNINGTSISYSAGKVGIGIETPTRELVISNLLSPDILIQQSVFTGTSINDGFMLGTNFSLDGEIWNFESAGIIFGTNNLEKMRILANGNVGINDTSPSEKLEVVGNIKTSGNINLTGEVNRPSTGSANMIPIVYGNVSAAGGIIGGTGNFTVSKLVTGVYEIAVTGETTWGTTNHFYSVSPLSANPQYATIYPFGDILRVEIFNSSGTNVDGIFSFIIYKL
jgi:hypothetical protein